MKRILAITVALMMATCLLAACGDDEIYRQPGNGTTIGGTDINTSGLGDDNGTYSASEDGDVSQTTDNNGILEDGMNDVENGIENGVDDLEQGMNDLEQGMDDMTGRDNMTDPAVTDTSDSAGGSDMSDVGATGSDSSETGSGNGNQAQTGTNR